MKQVTRVSAKTYPFTHDIEFLAVGVNEKRGKFLLVAKGELGKAEVAVFLRENCEPFT